jgi:hypothetical protein
MTKHCPPTYEWVFPFRRTARGSAEIALVREADRGFRLPAGAAEGFSFVRSLDGSYWQPLAGSEPTARRALRDVLGVTGPVPMYYLNSVSTRFA